MSALLISLSAHRGFVPDEPASEVAFHSETLAADVRCVLDVDTEPMHYQHCTVEASVQLLEIWHGDWECVAHLSRATVKCVESEARAAFAKAGAR